MEETTKAKVLNDGRGDDNSPFVSTNNEAGKELIKQLKIAMTNLKSNYIDEDTGRVDYRKMLESMDFAEYRRLTYKLRNLEHWVVDDSVSPEERKAFFINLYNCLMIDALAECSIHSDDGQETELPVSPLKVSMEGGGNIWNSCAYNVGGLILTLDDIEHGILRGNQPHPSKAKACKEHFAADDKRYCLVQDLDPRIHFALNCGAKSCPPIRVYSTPNLDSQLSRAAASFLCANEAIVIDENERTIKLSKLLLWYGCDFGNCDKEVLNTISGFIGQNNQDLAKSIEEGSKLGYKIIYDDYDWSLNSIDH